MKLVHLTLSRSLLSDPSLLKSKVQQIVTATGMTDINEKRLFRYAVLTGSVQDSKLQYLHDLRNTGIGIEIDSIRQLATGEDQL
jgi:hypothetical protein